MQQITIPGDAAKSANTKKQQKSTADKTVKASKAGKNARQGRTAATAPSQDTKASQQPQSQQPPSKQPRPDPWGDPWGDPWSDPWSDPWGGATGSGSPQPKQSKPKLSPAERVQMIEKVYEEVLGRKPDTRDINYYKYSTLDESAIRLELLQGKEHKELIKNGAAFKDMSKRTEVAETRVKMLEAKLADHSEEFIALRQLLEEKNKVIKVLRRQCQSPFTTNISQQSSPHFSSSASAVQNVSQSMQSQDNSFSQSPSPSYSTVTTHQAVFVRPGTQAYQTHTSTAQPAKPAKSNISVVSLIKQLLSSE